MYRAAVIGTGQPGLYHMAAYLRRRDVRLTALWGRSAGHTEELARQFGVPLATTDLDRILGDDQIDLVSICVPNHLHAEYAIRALQAGKHVFCEVPMLSRVDDAGPLLQAVAHSGLTFYVGQLDRVEPAFRAIKRFAEAGDLGGSEADASGVVVVAPLLLVPREQVPVDYDPRLLKLLLHVPAEPVFAYVDEEDVALREALLLG